ncbi:hypothetical protein [Algoriphagus aquimarinus]|uniref:Uncharacterized protein n=1 Tax=Algoriphagus aquimarinus TaxID=237018 RepID=A0A5C7ASP9_9BACT|nr:hypothetical protein [Algoriphagus aquimarinus]TXE08842.1 hypothetical protein ESV85_13545 [Algoriphagus aquimarinus]
MIATVNEPIISYQITKWLVPLRSDQIDSGILRIGVNIEVLTPKTLLSLPSINGTKTGISCLRGKIKRKSEDEINNRINELRNEWERDF